MSKEDLEGFIKVIACGEALIEAITHTMIDTSLAPAGAATFPIDELCIAMNYWKGLVAGYQEAQK
jgi:hypothetical protein